MKCVPASDHKFAALHGAVWSSGTFLYVRKEFTSAILCRRTSRMNAKNMGQFEHTLIVVEERANAHYIEGCSAPKYGSQALHAGLVEIFVKPERPAGTAPSRTGAETRIANTKRAVVEKDATMEWVGGNMGSGVTMLYPCSMLMGEGARCDHLAIAFANKDQWQDTGAKIFHMAPHTSSKVTKQIHLEERWNGYLSRHAACRAECQGLHGQYSM